MKPHECLCDTIPYYTVYYDDCFCKVCKNCKWELKNNTFKIVKSCWKKRQGCFENGYYFKVREKYRKQECGSERVCLYSLFNRNCVCKPNVSKLEKYIKSLYSEQNSKQQELKTIVGLLDVPKRIFQKECDKRRILALEKEIIDLKVKIDRQKEVLNKVLNL